jgi:predicted dehydrogenase
MMCLGGHKHVLCEKPFALNAGQAGAMIRSAQDRGLFLMEAMWSRFLPAYRQIRDLLREGAVGAVLRVEGALGFRATMDPNHRLFDLQRGGGALLDLGVYPIQFAQMVLGTPTDVTALARIGEAGVDEDTVVAMSFASGAVAIASAAIRTPLVSSARVIGVQGSIEIPEFMHFPQHVDLVVNGQTERFDSPMGAAPLGFEIAEVERRVRSGATESEVMPLAETLSIATTLDRARAAIGLRYPSE